MKCYLAFVNIYNGYSGDLNLIGVFKTIESLKAYMFKEFKIPIDQWSTSIINSNSTVISFYLDENDEDEQIYTIQERILQ